MCTNNFCVYVHGRGLTLTLFDDCYSICSTVWYRNCALCAKTLVIHDNRVRQRPIKTLLFVLTARTKKKQLPKKTRLLHPAVEKLKPSSIPNTPSFIPNTPNSAKPTVPIPRSHTVSVTKPTTPLCQTKNCFLKGKWYPFKLSFQKHYCCMQKYICIQCSVVVN